MLMCLRARDDVQASKPTTYVHGWYSEVHNVLLVNISQNVNECDAYSVTSAPHLLALDLLQIDVITGRTADAVKILRTQ